MQKWECLSLSLWRVMNKLVRDMSSCLEQVLAAVSSVIGLRDILPQLKWVIVYILLCVCVCVAPSFSNKVKTHLACLTLIRIFQKKGDRFTGLDGSRAERTCVCAWVCVCSRGLCHVVNRADMLWGLQGAFTSYFDLWLLLFLVAHGPS